jgi:hypothetical protein
VSVDAILILELYSTRDSVDSIFDYLPQELCVCLCLYPLSP